MIYGIGRYRLQMTDEELWACTPRRFLVLCDVVMGKPEREQYEAPTDANMFL